MMTPAQAAREEAAKKAAEDKKNQPKGEKRQSLYANQGGGMANPQQKRKKQF